ncbi:MAG: RimK/LysX family protein [Pseudomonadales bacterium]|nr:RimK/LysX family protein [Pseudomonadales bacterium]
MPGLRQKKLRAGALEHCDLPELGINHMQVRVDTGAAISSLHVDNIEEFRKAGKRWVSFDIHPDIHHVDAIIRATARVKGRKKIKSSSADSEQRVVIDTLLRMGGREWLIKLTLTNRSEMTYLMLLGREAMAGRIVVDPAHEFLLDQLPSAPPEQACP